MSDTYNPEFSMIGTILVQEGLLVEDRLNEALNEQKTRGKRLGETLIEMEYLDKADLDYALGLQMGMKSVDLDTLLDARPEIVRVIPEPFAKENSVLAFARSDNVLSVALTDPDDIVVVDNIRKLTEFNINPLLAHKKHIQMAIDKHYEAVRKSGEVEELLGGLEFISETEEGDETDLANLQKEVDNAPIVKLVNLILSEAIKSRATDIHIEQAEHNMVVRYRIDGVLQEVMTPPKSSGSGIVSRIKVLSKLNLAERRLPQDGRFTLKLPDREVDVRVSVLPTVLGEKVVLRLLDKTSFNLNLTNLGFDPEKLSIFRRWIMRPYGMVILSGPTGSGKSTTLYSSLNEIKSVETNIVTVEDPVEYQLDGIHQVQVNTKIDLTFGSALRSILRQDPDIVLIGEIRDLETADIAVKFSLTGHLVFSSLHANDAPSTVTRLLDIGIPPYLVASSLNLVMAQRLVRTICKQCKEPYTPSPEELIGLEMTEKDLEGKTVFMGRGCPHCRGTGYYGRTAVFEILEMLSPIRKLVFDSANPEIVREEALKLGMETLRQDALRKLFEGKTTVKEVLRVTIAE
ncbi:MAG: pilus assembly protein PilB [Gemmatimonadetes bacterium]|nr:MAG: pilus assembly protein PilB [Gemmatimonadota bacterium]